MAAPIGTLREGLQQHRQEGCQPARQVKLAAKCNEKDGELLNDTISAVRSVTDAGERATARRR
jgi:hypothetical protein